MNKKDPKLTQEGLRLAEADGPQAIEWRKWGPYLSERSWGTVREDYSPDGEAWHFLTHDMARSKAYRWGEDGLGGLCDRYQLLCFGLALWNRKDPILKERAFGVTPSQGNHGEDLKDYYFYLDSTPTHSFMRYLYKYPQAEYPYRRLVEDNQAREGSGPEVELIKIIGQALLHQDPKLTVCDNVDLPLSVFEAGRYLVAFDGLPAAVRRRQARRGCSWNSDGGESGAVADPILDTGRSRFYAMHHHDAIYDA